MRDVKVGSLKADGGGGVGKRPFKRKKPPVKEEDKNRGIEECSSVIMAKPLIETRGHTGFLTFARLICS